jgi:hypothetical protein
MANENDCINSKSVNTHRHKHRQKNTNLHDMAREIFRLCLRHLSLSFSLSILYITPTHLSLLLHLKNKSTQKQQKCHLDYRNDYDKEDNSVLLVYLVKLFIHD